MKHLRTQPRRRGSLYLSVLGVSFIVSVLALAGMHAARAHLAVATSDGDLYRARLLAASAVELGIAQLRSNPNWRVDYAVDVDYPATAVAADRGSFAWRLKSGAGRNYAMQGTGVVNAATCTLEVDLVQAHALDCALFVEGDVTVESGCTLTCEGAPAATNGTFVNDGATYADVEAQAISGYSVNGTATTPGALRVLPTPRYVMDYYLRRGTVLAPTGWGTAYITLTLLSPFHSSGDTNADGIYVIDTQGQNLSISSCRIVGTLVVANLAPGKKVTISGDVNWEPAYPNFPALLVDGDVEITMYSDGLLSESWITPNFNPAGAPFQGEEDDAKDDDFISSIGGLIYCSGDLTFDGGGDDRLPDLRGMVLVGGNCTLEDEVLPTIKYDETLTTAPPPGFAFDDDVAIVPGSWRQVESP